MIPLEDDQIYENIIHDCIKSSERVFIYLKKHLQTKKEQDNISKNQINNRNLKNIYYVCQKTRLCCQSLFQEFLLFPHKSSTSIKKDIIDDQLFVLHQINEMKDILNIRLPLNVKKNENVAPYIVYEVSNKMLEFFIHGINKQLITLGYQSINFEHIKNKVLQLLDESDSKI